MSEEQTEKVEIVEESIPEKLVDEINKEVEKVDEDKIESAKKEVKEEVSLSIDEIKAKQAEIEKKIELQRLENIQKEYDRMEAEKKAANEASHRMGQVSQSQNPVSETPAQVEPVKLTQEQEHAAFEAMMRQGFSTKQ